MKKEKKAPVFFLKGRNAHFKNSRSFFHAKEDGNIVDELGCIIVLAFMIAMIFAYAAYGRMVQIRLAIDNVAKEYLYQMEEKGCLTVQMQENMTERLREIGVTSVSFEGTSHLGTNQAPYGGQIRLECTVTFENPLYTMLSAEKKSNGNSYTLDANGNPTNPEGTMFTLAGLNSTVTYKVSMSATAKW